MRVIDKIRNDFTLVSFKFVHLTVLIEFCQSTSYKTARQAAAYAELTPQQRVSGTSVRGKSCLSKKGNVRVRKALYMPAVVAQRNNPILKKFRDRLRQKGKHPMAILGVLMRKLLHRCGNILEYYRTIP